MRLRLAALVGLPAAAIPGAAVADAPVEVTAFTGATYLGDDTGVGDSTAAELSVKPSLTFGARLSYVPWQRNRSIVGFELEAAHVLGSVVGRIDSQSPRHSSPALLFNYRAMFVIGLQEKWFRVHFATGLGATTLTTSSDLLREDTDAGNVFGVGLTFAITESIQMRIDGRQMWSESRDLGWSRSYELQVGVGTSFGGGAKKQPTLEMQPLIVAAPVPKPVPVSKPAPAPAPTAAAAPAPSQAPFAPAPRRAPTPAATLAPGPAIASIPAPTLMSAPAPAAAAQPTATPTAFAAASRVEFEPKKARLSDNAKAELENASLVLISNPKLRVTITVRPHAAGDAAKNLARKRANAVKWFLMERGAAEGQLATKLGDARAKPPVLELSLAP